MTKYTSHIVTSSKAIYLTLGGKPVMTFNLITGDLNWDLTGHRNRKEAREGINTLLSKIFSGNKFPDDHKANCIVDHAGGANIFINREYNEDTDPPYYSYGGRPLQAIHVDFGANKHRSVGSKRIDCYKQLKDFVF